MNKKKTIEEAQMEINKMKLDFVKTKLKTNIVIKITSNL
jgi:hypothetical protein